MAKKAPTRKQRIEAAEKPAPAREKKLLGWWRNVHCRTAYELRWHAGALIMRRQGSIDYYEKPAEAFERLLSFGCFTRLSDEPAL